MKTNNIPPSEPAPRSVLGIPANDSMDGGGTSPWMGEGRIMQEQLSRATQEAKAEAGIQDAVEPKVGALRRPLDSGLRRNDGKKLTGQQRKKSQT